MASGYPAGGGGGGVGRGGGAEFYTGITAGRSVANMMGNNHHPSQNPYRSSLSQLFLDPASQIAHHHQQRTTPIGPASLAGTATGLIGKRTLADFQQQQPQQQQQGLNPLMNGFYLRSVKPRMYQHTSPISTLSPIEFSPNNGSTTNINSFLSQDSVSPLPAASHRYSSLTLHQKLQRQQQQQQQQLLRHPPQQQQQPQPINFSQVQSRANMNNHLSTNQTLTGLPCMNANGLLQNNQRGGDVGFNNLGVVAQESENKMLNRLQELEKQLLDDDDDNDVVVEEGCDAVSVITNTNSEWSETIQNLMTSSNSNLISPSPTSSSSSSSSSLSSVTAPPVSRQTILDAASAISEGKNDVAAEILARVSPVSNPKGNHEQRLMEYMLLALKSRVNAAENPPPVPELYSKEHAGATQMLYDLSPCFKLGFVAANLAIVEAMADQANGNGFHVIDFDIGQGGQYVDLLQTISASRMPKPAIVKITAVADNGGSEEQERLKTVGDRLGQLAEGRGLSFKFNVVSSKLAELSRKSLGCEPEEAVAVNFAFKLYRMPDESVSTENPRDELLRRVKGLAPVVVTLVEQEMNTNTAPFMARASEACTYYGSLFESIELTVARENTDRVRAEEGLGRRLANSVACEGRDRVERCEVFGKWRARMGMAGFELRPMSQNVAELMKARLNRDFTVKEENGGVCFGWMGKTLTVASAWR